MPRNRLIQVRSGTTAQWAAANPVLALGEPGHDTDTKQYKIGDGVNAWSALAGTVSSPPVAYSSANGTDTIVSGKRTADAQPRWTIDADGKITWGDGTGAGDTNLYRLSANVLGTDDQIRVLRAADGDYGVSVFRSGIGDTDPRCVLRADGAILWSAGTGGLDTNLYRSAANVLKTDDDLWSATSVSAGPTKTANHRLFVSADTAARPVAAFRGAAAQTANLTEWQNSAGTVLSSVDATGDVVTGNQGYYRTKTSGGVSRRILGVNASAVLNVGDIDNGFTRVDCWGAGTVPLRLGASALAFFDVTTPITKPTVTGSRAVNPALASLLTALANLGLVADSTTA